MRSNRNIEVFPQRFIKADIKTLCKSISYFDEVVSHKETSEMHNNYYSIKLIPEYFNLTYRDSTLRVKQVPQYNWGYSILLNEAETLDAFMKQQFNSKKRNIMTRYVKRLEACFNIRYEFYHGDITVETYDFVMQSLYNMIVNRFKERNEIHKNIGEWEYLLQSSLDKIKNKTASLFVIYNEDEPIEISLNYHYDKILFSYVSSYHIDYSKFGLGHVEIYKQVEWCINNDYILFEMGVGGMDYKRRWSNNIYRYQHYIVYNTKTKILGCFSYLKIRLKEYLKAKKINEIYPILKTKFFSNTSKNNSDVTVSDIKPLTEAVILKIDNLDVINYSLEAYTFIKKFIFNFLYTSIDHINYVNVYKINENNYLIKGKTKYQEIHFVSI